MLSASLVLVVVSVPVVLAVARRTYALVVNYVTARKLGIPIIILPASWHDVWWLMIWKRFAWLQKYPAIGSWIGFSYHGWTQQSRYHSAHKYGDAFVLVSPGGNEIMISDPQACVEIQTRYKTWTKPEDLYDIFDTFGKNLITVNGENWQRHRKIMAPAFREQNNQLVWDESLRQARKMIDAFVNRPKSTGTLLDVRHDCVYVAMHVLSAAGFGHAQDFDTGLRSVLPGHARSLSDTSLFLLKNILFMTVFGNMKIPKFLQPGIIAEVKACMQEFRQYMHEAVAHNRATTQAGGRGNPRAADIVSALVEANEAAKIEEKGAVGKPIYLDDSELMGNLFLVNFAGFETTANVLTYSIPYLATNPDVQDWVGEEVDRVLGGGREWDYVTVFPSLVRCLAVMMETLRLWGPITDACRIAPSGPQTITVNGRNIVVPPDHHVSINIYSLHSDPRWWGADSLTWRPQRWVKTESSTGVEYIDSLPDRPVYMPWTVGPRICPGKKFSQVEFVAVIATLLKNYRLKPSIIEGTMQTMEEAARALIEVTEDSENIITPRMKKPEDAAVMVFRRV